MKTRVLLTSAILVACTATTRTSTPPVDLAITHATVIDVETGKLLVDRTILVAGNRIRRVGMSGDVPVPPSARALNGSGKYVIPGLWDMHVHTVSYELDFPLEVANGVTGVRDMGGSSQYPAPGNWGIHFDSLRAWRAAIRAGMLVGPRIVAAGVALDGPDPFWPQTLSIKSAAEARRVVDSLRGEGADFIKVYALLPKDILFAIAEEARAVGLPFAGHLSSFVTAEEAAAAGQRSLEHANALESSYFDASTLRAYYVRARRAPFPPSERAELLRQLLATFDPRGLEHAAAVLARNGTWSDPTLVTMRSLALPFDSLHVDHARMAYVPKRIRDTWSARLEAVFSPETNPRLAERLRHWEEAVRALHRRGVGILIGSDAWNPYVVPGFSTHDELELLVGEGMTPLETLRAATLGAARFLGMTDSLGTITPGKLADLVLLDGDPLIDIRNVRRIHAVVLDGRVLDRPALDALLASARSVAAR